MSAISKSTSCYDAVRVTYTHSRRETRASRERALTWDTYIHTLIQVEHFVSDNIKRERAKERKKNGERKRDRERERCAL